MTRISGGSRAMRKVIGTLLAIALVTGVAFVANRPGPAGAQGGGTIEATVTYAGAPVVEKLKVNKDTEKCGTEATIEKVVVGGNKGLANAVVSVPGAKGGSTAKGVLDQQGPAQVQEDDDGEAGEAGVRQGHLRRPQLDARLGGGGARPGGRHQRRRRGEDRERAGRQAEGRGMARDPRQDG